MILGAVLREMRFQLLTGTVLLSLGLALLGAPGQLEGPSLLHLAPGRGVSVSDVTALLVLTTSGVFFLRALWRHRTMFARRFKAVLAVGGTELFCIGLGTGLILAKGLVALQWGWLLYWIIIASPLFIALVIARHQY